MEGYGYLLVSPSHALLVCSVIAMQLGFFFITLLLLLHLGLCLSQLDLLKMVALTMISLQFDWLTLVCSVLSGNAPSQTL
jgi:hypothetical protein